jgi:hypothetical protein
VVDRPFRRSLRRPPCHRPRAASCTRMALGRRPSPARPSVSVGCCRRLPADRPLAPSPTRRHTRLPNVSTRSGGAPATDRRLGFLLGAVCASGVSTTPCAAQTTLRADEGRSHATARSRYVLRARALCSRRQPRQPREKTTGAGLAPAPGFLPTLANAPVAADNRVSDLAAVKPRASIGKHTTLALAA